MLLNSLKAQTSRDYELVCVDELAPKRPGEKGGFAPFHSPTNSRFNIHLCYTLHLDSCCFLSYITAPCKSHDVYTLVPQSKAFALNASLGSQVDERMTCNERTSK